ncbi:MAG: hypothetical protein LBR80_13650 [Deltaproteobacteria bacterium]|jgi:ATP-dependent DNA helicase RecG|nr:hypothetical protein [Deltaproteobacteria bacterium]
MTPAGVYTRQGTSSVHASDIAIKKMIGEHADYLYEGGISKNQNLTFSHIKSAFLKKQIAFDFPQMITLGVMNHNDLYTNLGLLLADQCEHIIKVGKFKNHSEVETEHQEDYGGSVLQQIDEVGDFLSLINVKP